MGLLRFFLDRDSDKHRASFVLGTSYVAKSYPGGSHLGNLYPAIFLETFAFFYIYEALLVTLMANI